MSPASITVLLTLLDDAYFLPEWAECVRRIAPEQVLVVDGGSKDGGPEYLETQNLPNLQIVSCPMESIDWDKSAMLNRSLDFARKDWILLLDADEVLWPPGRQWLDAALQHRPRGVVSLFLPRFHLYKNDRTRLVNRGSLDPQPRFWNRTAGIRWSRKAHPLQHLGDQGILGMHRKARMLRLPILLHRIHAAPYRIRHARHRRWLDHRAEASAQAGFPIPQRMPRTHGPTLPLPEEVAIWREELMNGQTALSEVCM